MISQAETRWRIIHRYYHREIGTVILGPFNSPDDAVMVYVEANMSVGGSILLPTDLIALREVVVHIKHPEGEDA